jgi:hypothetical protein
LRSPRIRWRSATCGRSRPFIYPTKALAVLSRREVERPRTLGLVPATAGYIDEADWEEIVDVVSKPVVARQLLEGRYEAGLTHLEYAERYPEQLRVDEEIGEIDTTWVVYGTRKRFKGELIGIPSPELFAQRPPSSEPTSRVVRPMIS